ncbi:1-phosphofructokinase family hexose kinase [Sediminibacterium sp.]|uniref:1-phosphofructokinase family hexose kinase n=1 Tax=Sediminibacterium sp. TaxID=1917865 RepID=UPI0025E89EF5|nr:1-phosphofructokinase family hexose kinase [Sediminibacterium sp.]MBT9485378.1 1-phosphofructokinase family hexose kinase [Sediminibacterium sp.]
MARIVTITLNPALDKSISVPELVPEKKLRALSAKVEPGGGGINISRALKKLGVASEAIILSGGYTGKTLEALLSKEQVAFTAIETEGDTRENFVVFDEDKKLQYRFGMPGERVSDQELGLLMQAIGNCAHVDYVVVSGSLPPGTSTVVFHEIANIAQQLNAKLIVDTSGDGLKAAVKEGLYLIKPNLRELASLVGKEWIDMADVIVTARQVIAAGACKAMAVSMGADGAMLITATEHYKAAAPQAPVLSTVGAGDSMVAGMLAALTKGWGWEQVLQYGVAAGSAATLHKGTELCSLADTERIFAQIKQN